MHMHTPFTPLVHPPNVEVRRLSPYAGYPIQVASHGWKYWVTGNTLLKPDKIERIILAQSDPRGAIGHLLSAYRREGYFLVAITASSTIAPKSTKKQGIRFQASTLKGTVHIFIVEGQITQIKSIADLKPFYSGLIGNPRLTKDELLRRALLVEDYARRNGQIIQPNMQPASQPGGTLFSIPTRPLPGYSRISGQLQLGNYGSRYVSTYVMGTNLSFAPGHGQVLTANYYGGLSRWDKLSAGSDYRTGGLGYSIVTKEGIYGADFESTYYRLGKISAPLYNTGNIHLYDLKGKQLLFANSTSQFWLVDELHYVSNHIQIFDGLFTLLNQSYNYGDLGFKYKSGYRFWGLPAGFKLDYSFNQGFSKRTGTFALYTSQTSPDPHFSYHQINFTLEQSLPKGFLGQFNLAGQWAYATLPQEQQWVLGGFGSLSAYHAGLITGDSGYSARMMLQAPGQSLGYMTFEPNVFIETGGARYRYIKGAWATTTDLGIGLNIATRWGTTATLLYAGPLKTTGLPDQVTDSHYAGLYFVMQQSF